MGVDTNNPILKKNRISTGIPDLDIALEGGFRRPSNTILIGPTGMEKLTLAFHFAYAGLKAGEAVLFVLADNTPSAFFDKAKNIGMDFSGENVYVIDAYSNTVGAKPEENPGILSIAGAGALNDLSLSTSEIIKLTAGKKLRVVYASLSRFLLYNPKESMLKFLQVIGGKLKNVDATTLYLVDEGVHDPQILNLVDHVFDEKFILSKQNNSVDLEIPNLNVSIPMRLGPNGLSVV